jgi:hypothetical protein
MALAINFVPDPVKAATEMTRVVQPGGWVATYMWDLPGGGIPVEPMFRALKSLGIAVKARNFFPGGSVVRGIQVTGTFRQGDGVPQPSRDIRTH